MFRLNLTSPLAIFQYNHISILITLFPWWMSLTLAGWALGIDRVNGFFILPAVALAATVFMLSPRWYKLITGAMYAIGIMAMFWELELS